MAPKASAPTTPTTLTVWRGTVWAAPFGRGPRDTCLSPGHFLGKYQESHYRLASLRHNVALVAGLATAAGVKSLRVCSPLAVSRNLRQGEAPPRDVLAALKGWDYPPSLGGWHTVGPREAVSYAIAAHFDASAPPPQLSLERLLEEHPAWPALSFARGFDVGYCAKLIAYMLDPRFYVDLNKPDSHAKLESYLGLTPANVALLGDYPFKQQATNWACADVLNCWLGGVKSRCADPNFRFLEKTYFTTLAHSDGNVVKACLAAGKRFVRFVRLVWLDGLCRRRHEPLFDPKLFFAGDEVEQKTAEAYIAHASTCLKN